MSAFVLFEIACWTLVAGGLVGLSFIIKATRKNLREWRAERAAARETVWPEQAWQAYEKTDPIRHRPLRPEIEDKEDN